MNNYPDGAEFDPNAPWNEKEEGCTCTRAVNEDCDIHGYPFADEARDRKIDDELTGD